VGAYELRWVRSAPGSEDGHSGLSFSVLDEAESGGCRLALVRLISPGGVRHFVVHASCSSPAVADPGLFFGLLGFREFAGCPVLGFCFWRVLGSCGEDAAGWLESRAGDWFRRFAAVLAPALGEWARALVSWRSLASCLRSAGVCLPAFEQLAGGVGAALDVAGGSA